MLGENCDAMCLRQGGSCDADAAIAVATTGLQSAFAAAGVVCSSFMGWDYGIGPTQCSVNCGDGGAQGACTTANPINTCSASAVPSDPTVDMHHTRLCPCEIVTTTSTTNVAMDVMSSWETEDSPGYAISEKTTSTSQAITIVLSSLKKYKLVAGLNGDANSVSVTDGSRYLRHQGYYIKLMPYENNAGFKSDASFTIVQPLSGTTGYFSLESTNYPNHHFICTKQQGCQITPNAYVPGTASFKQVYAGIVSCSPGTYAPFTAQSSCINCPAGSYTNNTASVVCRICPVGHACPEGAHQPTPCVDPSVDGALITTGAGQPVCGAMPPTPRGYVRDGKKLMPTPPGTYSLNGMDLRNCTPGRFAPYEGTITCIACAPGSYTDESGLSTCKVCPAGSACAGETAIPTMCPPNMLNGQIVRTPPGAPSCNVFAVNVTNWLTDELADT